MDLKDQDSKTFTNELKKLNDMFEDSSTAATTVQNQVDSAIIAKNIDGLSLNYIFYQY